MLNYLSDTSHTKVEFSIRNTCTAGFESIFGQTTGYRIYTEGKEPIKLLQNSISSVWYFKINRYTQHADSTDGIDSYCEDSSVQLREIF